jgi:two-component system chemotaxis response regulator CheY
MPVAKELTVVFADDQETMRAMGKAALEKMGFEAIHVVDGGRAALQVMGKSPVHMVISDLHMPDVDGMKLLKTIRAHPTTRRVPFILVTAATQLANIKDAKKEGANNYVLKPFDAATLKQKIEQVVGPLY